MREDIYGIKKFQNNCLGDIVILAGSNGSGKTRLIKLLINTIKEISNLKTNNIITIKVNGSNSALTSEIANKIKIVNYSHYDAYLQIPNKFPPYVIHNAKGNLIDCNYEETALNALLWIYDLACQNSDKDEDSFIEFSNFAEKYFGLKISANREVFPISVKIFNEDINKSNLSPGQQYLLRIAVACWVNRNDDNMLIFLDEPELHLHPEALINTIEVMLSKFKNTQFWISTHSLTLIAYLVAKKENTTVFNLIDGKPLLLRSDSHGLIKGLIGSDDNRQITQQFLSTPDEYACNKFSIESYIAPATLEARANDPQNEMVRNILHKGDIVVDYGVGKGRFIEGLGMDNPNLVNEIQYYAYDIDAKDSVKCKSVMEALGISTEQYTNDINELQNKVSGRVQYVILVNVLHEIDPKYWINVFAHVYNLLNENGKLIIVEQEEITVGEWPYDNGFLVITESGAQKLFGKSNFKCEHYEKIDAENGTTIKKPIVKYSISKEGVSEHFINRDAIKLCIEEICSEALNHIKELRKEKNIKNGSYKLGLKTSFWLHQYANSSLILKDEFNKS